jgi:hypothetical protein
VDDIDTGLRNWSRLGLASTKGLFDAQTRRNLQNDECGLLGGEDTDLRGGCESGIGMLDVIIDATNDFVNQFLLSMLGAPDVVGQVRSILQDVMDAFDDIVNTVLAPINPLREALEDVKNFAKELLKDAISAVLGVDIDSLKSFLTEPSRWVCTDNTTIHFPAPLGDQTLSLFPDGEHERLDDLLGFPPGDGHHVQEPSLPLACGRLQDAAEVQFAAVPALRNTVTTAKLLMLDGPELNRALSDILGRTVVHYSAGQNMMVDALQPGETWLQSIDGDHAWRQDGLPRFCDEGGNCPGQADPRPAELNGGAGNFPIWESCVLRPAFRALYADWEGGSFPDLDDDVSADDADDPQAPISTLQASGTVYNNGTTTFVAAAHQLTQAAHDGPDGFAFRDDQLALQRRVFADGDVAGPFQAVTQGSSVTLTGTDGLYHVEVQSADDCHRFDGAPSPPEAVQTHSFVLDATAPTIDLVRPANGTEWDTDDTPVVDLQVEDGGLGSGVKRTIGTVGGWDGPGGVWSFDRGDALDMFTFMPGTHTVAVTAIDHLDNTREVTFTFDLHATPQSLLANVQRAARSGLLKAPLGTTLRRSLDAARKAHEQGRHLAEGRNLQAFITQIQSARGQKADPRTVARLVAFAQDRIRLGR